jgi:hypothetical protein
MIIQFVNPEDVPGLNQPHYVDVYDKIGTDELIASLQFQLDNVGYTVVYPYIPGGKNVKTQATVA